MWRYDLDGAVSHVTQENVRFVMKDGQIYKGG